MKTRFLHDFNTILARFVSKNFRLGLVKWRTICEESVFVILFYILLLYWGNISDTLNWSDITPICELMIELDLITDFDLITKLREVFIEHCNWCSTIRGRLLLRTPGPVPFGICICSNVETIFSWTYHVLGLRISNIPRYFYFAFDHVYSINVFSSFKITVLLLWFLFYNSSSWSRKLCKIRW